MIDEIRGPLEKIHQGVDGALAITLMGMDGLPVDTLHPTASDHEDLDVSSLVVEYSTLLNQVKSSAQMFAAGGLEELAISSEHLTMIIRPVTDEYFLALALTPGANFGKGRYLLRVLAPTLAGALS
ncbi:MAG: roadblock/LC7 domain-containing protein [Deltaproteobacteria bacterium]|jgi:predicted regulator of Ras-like GTPase activity (Roadblock/LC7/MglB family)